MPTAPKEQTSPHPKKAGGKSKLPTTTTTTTTPIQRQGDRGSDDDDAQDAHCGVVILRFNDLKARNIVRNWMTLRRWIEHEGFPPGIQLAVHSRGWFESDVMEWLRSRPAACKQPKDVA